MVIFGIDEAGRGALCGPVAAACVSFSYSNFTSYSILQDSKRISAIQRKNASIVIKKHAYWGFGWAYPHEIDTLNIHHASLLAMQRAYTQCTMYIQHRIHTAHSHPLQSFYTNNQQKDRDNIRVLVDGKFCPQIPVQCQAIVKGDTKVPEIQAASILAKVARDELMELLHQAYPLYHMNIHKGYPTAKHKQAIRQHGMSSIHRKSFSVR